jgi:hypothetical protein
VPAGCSSGADAVYSVAEYIANTSFCRERNLPGNNGLKKSTPPSVQGGGRAWSAFPGVKNGPWLVCKSLPGRQRASSSVYRSKAENFHHRRGLHLPLVASRRAGGHLGKRRGDYRRIDHQAGRQEVEHLPLSQGQASRGTDRVDQESVGDVWLVELEISLNGAGRRCAAGSDGGFSAPRPRPTG